MHGDLQEKAFLLRTLPRSKSDMVQPPLMHRGTCAEPPPRLPKPLEARPKEPVALLARNYNFILDEDNPKQSALLPAEAVF